MVAHIQIGDISPRIQYSGDGVQTVFPYPFPVFADADIQTYVDGTLQSLTSDYTVVGAGISTGGSITYIVPPVAGAVVTLRRNKRIARTSDFQESGEFRAKVINDELDILTALLQQVDEQSARALHLAPTDAANQTELPDKAARAGMYLGFDAAGAPTMIAGPLNTVPVSTFASALLDDVDAAAARVTLGGVIGVDVLSPTGDGSGLTGIVTGATDAEKSNIALNAFRIAVNSGLSVQNMVDGVVDEFTDQTGVDTVASLNETYDAAGDYYHNIQPYSTDQIPVMTSNIAPSGIASASNEAGGPAWHCMMDNLTLGNAWQANAATAWVAYEFTAVMTAGQYSLQAMAAFSSYPADGYPKSWTFEGWTGVAWVVLDTQTNAPAWALSEKRSYPIAVPASYIKYRLNITLNQGNPSWTHLGEFEIMTGGAALDMTLISVASTALAQPSSVFAVLWHEFVDAVTLGADLKVWVSRDGGVTWTQVTLTLGASLAGNQQVLIGTADVSAQPAGTSLKWKIETLNAKAQYVRGVSEQWS